MIFFEKEELSAMAEVNFMTSRQYKKLNIKARITWICDRYGTVERGYLADYFTKFPNDWRSVRKMLRQRKNYRILYMLNKDVKNQYKHSDYKKETSDNICFIIRNACFIRYYKCKDPILKCSSEFSLHNLNLVRIKL